MLFLILVIELVVLFFLSRWLTRDLFRFFLLLFRSRTVALTLLLVLEFPGTVVHELSHLFTAEILGVRTGKLMLEPESIRDERIKSGSVQIAETDPFRKYAIGLAPIFWGILMLTAVSYFLPQLIHSVQQSDIPLFQNPNTYFFILAAYLMFAVSNSMFSSPTDLKGFLPFAIALTIIIAVLYFVGIRLALAGTALTIATTIVTTLTNSIGIVLGINVILLILTLLLTKLFERIFKLRVV